MNVPKFVFRYQKILFNKEHLFLVRVIFYF